MHILDNFNKDLIQLNISLKTKDEIFLEIARMVEKSGFISDGEEIFEKLISREELMTTGIGNGFAIPHAFADGLTKTIVLFISLKNPIEFQAVDNKPVSYIFALIGPKNKQVMHLKMLARVSRLINNKDFIIELGRLHTIADFLQIVEKFDNEIAV